MLESTRQRKAKQPLSLPSAGSVFKRPKGRFAGALIENCGLKGFAVGGAQISPLHAGFIVNNGNATERDVLELISVIQQRVFDETGVRLERELKLLSEL
jgi:UDP-N-acetylmuramate dehydrogenase